MKFISTLFFLFSFLSTFVYSQTYKDIQSNLESERQKILKHRIIKLEIYSYKKRDSILEMHQDFDQNGNLIYAIKYNHKSNKYYSEERYEYDSLGRRTTRYYKDTHLDKINKANGIMIEKYIYIKDTLTSVIWDYHKNDVFVSSNIIPEHKIGSIDSINKVYDSLNRIIQFEFQSHFGYEKITIDYQSNGKIKTYTSFVKDMLWFSIKYNEFGNQIELYSNYLLKKSKRPIEHCLTFYNDKQLVIKKEYLKPSGKKDRIIKHYYTYL